MKYGIRALLKGGQVVHPLDDTFSIRRALPHGHVAALLGLGRQLGLPVQSFRTLLAVLGTLTLNQVTLPNAPQHPFAMFAKPTPVQAKAFDLVGVDPTRFVASKWPG